MGDGSLSQLTYWRAKWVIPAALVKAAVEIGSGDVRKGLEVIVERGEFWMKNLAVELLYNREELGFIVRSLQDGLRADEELVERIKKAVLDN